MTAVREKPILFSGAMVRAILAGKKQTRRVMKPQPDHVHTIHVLGQPLINLMKLNPDADGNSYPYFDSDPEDWPGHFTPGMRLWVRETWCTAKAYDTFSPLQIGEQALEAGYRRPWMPVKYAADDKTDNADVLGDFGGEWGKGRPAIHMPRWLSRFTLEVTKVRIERVQDLSEVDAIDEGMISLGDEWLAANFPEWHTEFQAVKAANEALMAAGQQFGRTAPPLGPSPRQRFVKLWDGLNAERGYSWERNPWVWVVEFRRVAQ